MSYKYENQRPYVMSDEGQRNVMRTLDYARKSAPFGGAVTTFGLMRASSPGDSWKALAIVDRLEEMGYLKRVGVGLRPDDKVYVVKEQA